MGVGCGGQAMQLSHQRRGGGRRWPTVRTEGLQRQYHGKGPHQKGSIALSQVVEGGARGGWRREASRGSREAAPCQSREMSFVFTAQPSGQCPGSRLSAATAIRDEPQGRQGVATKEFRFLCRGSATAGWVQGLPLGVGEPGKGHEFATHYK